MRKLIVTTALIVAAAGCSQRANAQSNILDALKGVASAAADKVTGGKLTAKAIIGTWNYVQPGVKLSSSDTLSDLAASAAASTIEGKLDTYYQKVGIKAGACSFVINDDGTFTSTFGQKTSGGTYTFNAETHELSLKYDSGLLRLGTAIPAYAYMNGTNMQIVFPADKLLTILTKLGTSISSLKTFTALLEKYDSVKIGFEFSK